MFPLTLASSTIVHPLSGPSIGNSTQIYRENRRRRSGPIWLCSKSVKSASANTSGLARILFSSLLSFRIGVFITPILFPMIDSLVRVSRRDEWNHFQFDVSVRRSNAPSRAVTLFLRAVTASMRRVSAQLLPRSAMQSYDALACKSVPFDGHTTSPSALLMHSLTNRIKRLLRRGKVKAARRFRRGPNCRAQESIALTFIHFLWFGFRYWFHSHLKVLCIFPSQYFFAIGLRIVFSFRWNLPSDLRSNLKERDSWFGPSFPCGKHVDACTALRVFHSLWNQKRWAVFQPIWPCVDSCCLVPIETYNSVEPLRPGS